MKNFIKTLSIISALTLFSTAVFAEAAGREVTVYPGSICKPIWSSSNKNVQYSNGAIVPLAPMSVMCPLVREISDVSDVRVTVLGNKGSGRLSCYLQDTSLGGGTKKIYWTNSATNTGSYFISRSIQKTHYWGSYNLYCYLPSSGARITQIAIEEKYI